MKSVSLFSNKLVIYLTSFICGMIFVLLSLSAMIKLFYPVCYLETIKEYAKEYGIETSLVLAIINTESGFNRFAFSNKGAVGLMQIGAGAADRRRCGTQCAVRRSESHSVPAGGSAAPAPSRRWWCGPAGPAWRTHPRTPPGRRRS